MSRERTSVDYNWTPGFRLVLGNLIRSEIVKIGGDTTFVHEVSLEKHGDERSFVAYISRYDTESWHSLKVKSPYAFGMVDCDYLSPSRYQGKFVSVHKLVRTFLSDIGLPISPEPLIQLETKHDKYPDTGLTPFVIEPAIVSVRWKIENG